MSFAPAVRLRTIQIIAVAKAALRETKSPATSTPGDAQQTLRTLWSDPDFDASQPAFYYVRAIEQPSCRWSTWDALRMDWETPDEVPSLIQERVWSSPIWYRPAAT